MKIVFVIKALSNPGGGAERVLVDVASGLAERGHGVTVITSDQMVERPYYRLSNAVRQVFLGIGDVGSRSTIRDVVRRVWLIRQKLVELDPDVVVAFMHSSYLPVGIALLATGIPVVASEHIGPEHYQRRPAQKVLLLATPLLVKRITVVSQQIKDSFSGRLQRMMVVAPNPVTITRDTPDTSRMVKERRKELRTCKNTVLSVGRLAPQKDHACLIDAFSLVAREFSDWRLRIVGEGELRPELEKQIRRLELDRQVDLPGAMSDLSSEYQNAGLFVMPSAYESFGLATAEALLHGIPVVGFADCSGINVLVKNNINGVLVDGSAGRIAALANTLRALMAAPDEIARLSNASTRDIEDGYGLLRVLNQWEAILRSVTL